ncbi:unnamed protein product [Bursaphelenchus okinawaensis]|uniref:G protein-coupled receptor n=1 Tax=Bursaphelenchus okinawaensis TaxID=465554 RepID=A0A811K4U2_9BILA|nr:unnamed protein product [Bursaphelenchus okinawaensis]CAG9091311.1 unnamed protein product [Bursaphelenchus okinawaensis]
MNLHFQPTDDNPYAWDFADNITGMPTKPYDELESISLLLRISYIAETSLGGTLSFTMLYLVLCKSNSQLKPYSRMLLLCTLTDITYWATDNFIQVKSKLSDGVFMVKMEGPARYLSYNGQVVSMSVYVIFLSFIHTILPAQYYYRYYLVTRSKTLSICQTLVLYTISFMFAFPMGLIAYPAYSISAQERPGFNYGTLWFREVPVPPILYADIRSIYHKSYFIYAIMMVGGGYVFALGFAYKTMVYLRTHKNVFTSRTKAMHDQLSRALLFQVIIYFGY